jgi:hypothetical protein
LQLAICCSKFGKFSLRSERKEQTLQQFCTFALHNFQHAQTNPIFAFPGDTISQLYVRDLVYSTLNIFLPALLLLPSTKNSQTFPIIQQIKNIVVVHVTFLCKHFCMAQSTGLML